MTFKITPTPKWRELDIIADNLFGTKMTTTMAKGRAIDFAEHLRKVADEIDYYVKFMPEELGCREEALRNAKEALENAFNGKEYC